LFPSFDRQPLAPLPRLLAAEGSMARQRKAKKTIARESASGPSAGQGVCTDLETTCDRAVSSPATNGRRALPERHDNWPSQPAVTASELNVIESFFSELVDEIIKR